MTENQKSDNFFKDINQNQPNNNTQQEAQNNASMFFRKNRSCPICNKEAPYVNYKNPADLYKFTSEGGRILPSRITNTCAKHQRKIKEAIKLSRIIGLMKFVSK